ncbi:MULTISPECIES: rhamnan synthesis F family protein [Agrobacterium]|uniref:rhamnan synthesis F family protein n=1 Tax=Agrobacterium TaxID=357 RepID=UPI001E3312EC|nr:MULTISPECIES: rhamnan synthesis F family protein [Agrobacterium]UHS58215.1 hypothetical protein HRS00_14830 [Agrobacterium vaccinii]
MDSGALWKLKRELIRVFRQVEGPLKSRYFRYRYDLITSKEVRSTEGEAQITDEVALYLIYPDAGVLPSHLNMLDEIINAGITPIVVSNLPLTRDGKKKILNRCSVLIERPNVGYDFGGYRDGILSLSKGISRWKRLWLFNDSTWYIPQKTSWFDAVRQRSEDFIGASSTSTRGGVESFRDVHSYWPYSIDSNLFHYGSFALSIGPRILSDPAFLRFWRKLNITDDKKQTVVRGELGLTQWVKRHRYSHCATTNLDELDVIVSQMALPELRSLAETVLLLDNAKVESLRKSVCQVGSDGKFDRPALEAFILFATARFGFAYAMADFIIGHRQFHFLKKSPVWLNSTSARTIEEIAERIPGFIGESIRNEVRGLRGRSES